MKALWLGVAILLSSNVAFAATRVCVSVQQKSWWRPKAGAAARPASAAGGEGQPLAAPTAASLPTADPFGPPQVPATSPDDAIKRPPPIDDGGTSQKTRHATANRHEIDPTLYLKRMLEYEVTHEPGFAAVGERCQHTLAVEMYQLESGWTAFARYSGTEREEKVDRVELDEFVELAQRIAFSLLRNRSISQTITRENVLRADSEVNLRTIDGTGHLLFGMGTAMRMGRLGTAQQAAQPVASELRLLTPVSLQAGYRRKLRGWGLDAFARLNLGTENTGIHRNDLGGHIDYTASALLGLHFLHYLNAAGVNSFYFGGGAAFEIAWFEAIRPVLKRGVDPREGLVGGGLNVDFLVGYEFLRASSVHFFGQLELNAPTYLLKTENESGSLDTYMPGALAQIGVVF